MIEAALGPMLQDQRTACVMEIEAVGVLATMEQQRRPTIRRLAAAVDTALDAFVAAGIMDATPKACQA